MAREDLHIGDVVGVHGLQGVLKIRSYAESPEIFAPNSRIVLASSQGPGEAYTVQWVKPHKKGLLMAFVEVKNRDTAEVLVGNGLYIDKDGLPALDEDTYYWFELIGLSVFSDEDEYLGRIASVIPTGSNDVLVVKSPDKGAAGEILIPLLASVIQDVDLVEKTMRVVLPEGL